MKRKKKKKKQKPGTTHLLYHDLDLPFFFFFFIRMISRLPKENTLLLRHLLALMHTIQANAQENHMTSLNLGVCVSASMLWQPGPPSSPEGHGVRRVSTD